MLSGPGRIAPHRRRQRRCPAGDRHRRGGRSDRRRTRVRGATPGARPGGGLVPRRRRDDRRRRARGLQPRGPVEHPGRLRLREQPLFRQHEDRTPDRGHVVGREDGVIRHPVRDGRRQRRDGRPPRGQRRGRRRSGRRRPLVRRMPDLSAGRSQARRPCHVPAARRGRALAGARPTRADADAPWLRQVATPMRRMPMAAATAAIDDAVAFANDSPLASVDPVATGPTR